VTTRPEVILSVAVSLDGHIDDAAARRLVLSGLADLDEVDELRASCDAIVVGAGTVRCDDPSLVVRSAVRRARRRAAGLPATPVQVVLTRSGRLPLDAALFRAAADVRPVVLVPEPMVRSVTDRLSGVADVGTPGPTVDPGPVLAELAGRGAARVLVEGGTTVATAFLSAAEVDVLRLAVAPVFVADPAAPRLVGGPVPGLADAPRGRLESAHAVGDTAVLTYRLREGHRPVAGGPGDGG
jgi:5-amino-6-(5-phosphoribosylamino)uracil reductase